MKQYIIRVAEHRDIPSIQELMTLLSESDHPYDRDVDLQWAYSVDGLKYIKDRITNPGEACFVVEYNKSIVGYCTASIKELPSWRLVKVAEIENVFIEDNYRRNGLGRKLVETVVKWAKELRVNRIAVSVFSPNSKAISFYSKIEFTSYDMTMEMSLEH